MRWTLVWAVILLAVEPGALSAQQVEAKPEGLQPGPLVDYAPLAFQPETWAAKKRDTHLLPWVGKQIVFLTTPGQYDPRLMARWVHRLDAGWALYAELTGAKPAPFKQINGRVTIAAVPDFDYTCGAGCGYVGQGGIELAMFYGWNYPSLQHNSNAMPHYVFYEMGRNYYTFGGRHSCFITGFAVFMRYVCMDTLKCEDEDLGTRRTIEQAQALVRQSNLPFLRLFTNADGLSEKEPRLKNGAGEWINPTDQPVMYSSAMLRLYREHGGNDWLKRFFRALGQCAESDPNTREGALQQCWNWLLCSSIAARADLSSVFVDDWHMPLAPETRQALARVDWTRPDLGPATLDQTIHPVWR